MGIDFIPDKGPHSTIDSISLYADSYSRYKDSSLKCLEISCDLDAIKSDTGDKYICRRCRNTSS
jgi:hypothetical protein